MTHNHATTLKRQRRKQTIPTLYLSEAIKAEYQCHLVGMYSRRCQIGMQGPQLCTKPRHFCRLDVATSRMAFLDLNLHVLQLAT